jgi:hypothetical protein
MHIEILKKQARKNCDLEAHRAKNDVAYFLEFYKLAQEIKGKNNE